MVVATFRGRFEDFDAQLEVAEDGSAKLVGTVDPRTIVVKDENLAGHLQSPDFFDTERYPELRFESTSIRIEGDEAIVEGELTIKGNTEPRHRARRLRRPARGHRRQHQDRPDPRDRRRPHAVRPQLERPAAQGRLRPGERGHADRRARAREGVIQMRVLGISGSLRRDSHNTELLRAAATLLPSGVEFEIYDGLRGHPAVRRGPRGRVRRSRSTACARRSARRTRSCSPRRSTTTRSRAHLKNALDWVSRPFATNTLRNKPVAVMGASTGMFGAVWAQAEPAQGAGRDRRARRRPRDPRADRGRDRPRPRQARVERHPLADGRPAGRADRRGSRREARERQRSPPR